MINIRPVEKGNLVGESKLQKQQIKQIFDFCKDFDISKEETGEYVFDVRGGVIHWLDPSTKSICSSLYFDETKGNIHIELGDSGWNGGLARDRWKEVIETALGGN